jgi:hypothetical protein
MATENSITSTNTKLGLLLRNIAQAHMEKMDILQASTVLQPMTVLQKQ